jgi:perosamine synthetase
MTPQGVEEMGVQFRDLLGGMMPKRTKSRRMKVADALAAFTNEEALGLVDMDRVREIADRYGLSVIEDAAEAHGATCRGRKVGSFGDMACFSFYANKVITTGEGGMVTTNDDSLATRLRLLRNLAFTKPRFRHELAGFNFRMTGYQAGMGLAQLEKIESIIAQKRRVATTYCQLLSGTPGLQFPEEAAWARNVYWMVCVVVRPEFGISRNVLAAALQNDGIDTRTFFCPMNQQPCLRLPEDGPPPCPVADRLWESGLYLPSTNDLPAETIRWICDRVQAAAQHQRGAAA